MQPDLSRFDMEFAELTDCRIEEVASELVMQLRCPTSGWAYKRLIASALNWTGLNRVLATPRVEFDVELRFKGIENVRGSMLAEDRSIRGELFRDGFPVVSDFRIGRGAPPSLFLEAEDLTLECSFNDCVQREIGRDYVKHGGSDGPVALR